MARRGKGIPAQGVPVLVGQRWGIPHSPGLLKPAFQAAPPVTAGWWLLATTDFSLCLPRVRDGCAAYKDQQPDARVTPPACVSHGRGSQSPAQLNWGALLGPASRLLSFAASSPSFPSRVAFLAPCVPHNCPHLKKSGAGFPVPTGSEELESLQRFPGAGLCLGG